MYANKLVATRRAIGNNNTSYSQLCGRGASRFFRANDLEHGQIIRKCISHCAHAGKEFSGALRTLHLNFLEASLGVKRK
eukprot:244684-Pelagomonas_calceolata.AAC.2